MSAKENRVLVRRFLETWNKGKAAAISIMEEIYAPDFVAHSGTGEDVRGINAVKQSVNEEFKAFPDLHYVLDDMVVEGDKVAARYTMTGTHKGEFMGIPATNRKVTVRAMSIDRIVGGKFVEEWGMFDTLSLMHQLGIVPTPEKGRK